MPGLFAPRNTKRSGMAKIFLGRTTLAGPGATQLDGATLAVETFSLPAGEFTTCSVIG